MPCSAAQWPHSSYMVPGGVMCAPIPLIQQSAGGLLLKVKNLGGDRVIHAQEFWRQHGCSEEFSERDYSVHWSGERAALLLVGISTS